MSYWQLSLISQPEEPGLCFGRRLSCKLTPERIQDIRDSLLGHAPREFYRVFSIYKEIESELNPHNPILPLAILMMFINPDSENSLIRLLLEPGSRKKMLRELKRMQEYSNKEELRSLEYRLNKVFKYVGGDSSLFETSNSEWVLGGELEQYLLNRKLRIPLVMDMPITADGTIQPRDRIFLRDYLESLELQQFKVERAIQELIQEFCSNARSRSIISPADLVYTSLSTVGVKRNIDSIINSLYKEKQKDPARDISIGDINDLLRGRIVVEDYMTLAAFMRLIESKFDSQILQVKNKFIDHKDKAYRAIHYYIRLSDTILFELQVKLGAQVVIGELEHEVVFKNNKFDFISAENMSELKSELIALHWGIQKKSLTMYIQALLQDKAFVRVLRRKDPESFEIFKTFLRYEQGAPKL